MSHRYIETRSAAELAASLSGKRPKQIGEKVAMIDGKSYPVKVYESVQIDPAGEAYRIVAPKSLVSRTHG